MDTFPEISVPLAERMVDLTMRDGAIIRLRRFGKAGGIRLALSHGNGLATNCYAPFWLPLAEQFEITLFDIRNHGENPLHDPRLHTWASIIADFEEIFQGIQSHFGVRSTIGVFHSLAAIAALNHALTHGARWRALAAFDPAIFPRDGHPLQPIQRADMIDMSRRAARRPERYERPEQLAAQLARRPSFRRWVPGAHMLLARSTLRPAPDGSWVLRCPRELEAHIFDTNRDPTLWPRMRGLNIPAILITGDPTSRDSGPPAHIGRAIHEELGIEYAAIAGTTHFLQIERPEACRAALIGFLERHRLLEDETLPVTALRP